MNKELWIEIKVHLREELGREPTEQEIADCNAQLNDEAYKLNKENAKLKSEPH